MTIECPVCLEFKDIECGRVAYCSNCGHPFNRAEITKLWDTFRTSDRAYRRRLNISLIVFVVVLFVLVLFAGKINRISFFEAGVLVTFALFVIYNSVSSGRTAKTYPSIYKNSRVKL